jgi:hypothetical protein
MHGNSSAATAPTRDQLEAIASLATDLLEVERPMTETAADLTIAQLRAMDPDRDRAA